MQKQAILIVLLSFLALIQGQVIISSFWDSACTYPNLINITAIVLTDATNMASCAPPYLSASTFNLWSCTASGTWPQVSQPCTDSTCSTCTNTMNVTGCTAYNGIYVTLSCNVSAPTIIDNTPTVTGINFFASSTCAAGTAIFLVYEPVGCVQDTVQGNYTKYMCNSTLEQSFDCGTDSTCTTGCSAVASQTNPVGTCTALGTLGANVACTANNVSSSSAASTGASSSAASNVTSSSAASTGASSSAASNVTSSSAASSSSNVTSASTSSNATSAKTTATSATSSNVTSASTTTTTKSSTSTTSDAFALLVSFALMSIALMF